MNTTETYLATTLAALMNVEVTDLCSETPLDQQGVDSFVGLRLAKRIEKDLGIAISLKSIFDYPNLRDIAAAIDARPARA